jgi:putative resolvase
MFFRVSEAAAMLGVSVVTMRRWDRFGIFSPSWRSPGGHRRYDSDSIRKFRGESPEAEPSGLVVGYARVSSFDQKEDLERQTKRVEDVVKTYENHQVISDLGSGLNFKKRGLRKLLDLILAGRVAKLVVVNKDRLLRFGFEVIEKMVRFFGGEIVVLDAERVSDEEELSRDVLSIITVFSARLYGKRSHKNKRILAATN